MDPANEIAKQTTYLAIGIAYAMLAAFEKSNPYIKAALDFFNNTGLSMEGRLAAMQVIAELMPENYAVFDIDKESYYHKLVILYNNILFMQSDEMLNNKFNDGSTSPSRHRSRVC